MDPGASDRADASLTKGSVVRGLALALSHEGKLDAVLAALAPAARELLANPPPSSVWIDLREVQRIPAAIEALYGPAETRRLSAAGVRATLLPLVAGFVQGMLRLFGASPATVFSRLDKVLTLTNRGVTSQYNPRSARAGTLRVEYALLRDVPIAVFHAVTGSIDVIFDLSGVRDTGTVAEPRIVPDGRHNAADFDVAW